MGVSGLMSYCKERRFDISDRVDLLHVARQTTTGASRQKADVGANRTELTHETRSCDSAAAPVVILVDYYAFESYILPKVLLVENEKRGSGAHDPHLRLLGGEYEAYGAFVRRFLEALRGVGVSFVFFIDSARGSTADVAAHKLETWKERFRETLDFFADIRRVCDGKLQVERLKRDKLVRPCLLTVQTLISIGESGCEVISCVNGEADRAIGYQFHERSDVFAVLSHDSDFAVMRGCRFIPIDWFDVHGHFMAFVTGKKQALPSLCVDVTTPEKVAFSLGLPSPQSLVELAILKGNDYTRPFLKNMNLRQHLGLRNFSLQNFAGFVARFGSIENSDYFWQRMRSDADFRSAVEYSRDFYGLRPPTPSPPIPSSDPGLTHFIEVGVSRGDFPLIFLAMHRGFYWHRELLGDPNVEVALLELRRLLYDMLLPSTEPLSSVVEYYRGRAADVENRNVFPRGRYPNLLHLKSANEEERVAIFSDIFLSLEDGGDDESIAAQSTSSLARDLPMKERFVALTLRYFLRLSRGCELRLRRAEADAVVASVCRVMSRHALPVERPTASVKRRRAVVAPSFRCLTVFNWVQEVYLYAFNLFGKALWLSRYFPPPSELFEGTTFVRFFMSAAEGEGRGGGGGDSETRSGCREEIETLFDAHRRWVQVARLDIGCD